MTVSVNKTFQDPQDGDGVTVAFPFALRNDALTDIRCRVLQSDGTVIVPTFSVTGDSSGGTVTIIAPSNPPAVGEKVLISRDTALLQKTNYEAGDFPASAHERAIDKLTMAAQERAAITGRTLRLDEFSDEIGDIPPVDEGRVLIRTASGFGPGPTADEISQAQPAAEAAQTSAAEAQASAAAAATFDPALFAQLTGATFNGLVEVNREAFTMFRLRRDVTNGYRADFNMNADGSEFSFRLNGSTDTDYLFVPGLPTDPPGPSAVLTRRMGDERYYQKQDAIPKAGTVRVVAEHILSDDTEYTTGSQGFVTFKEYLITEKLADSRLLATLECYASPYSGSDGDVGMQIQVFCTDSAGAIQTIDGQYLYTFGSKIVTSTATGNPAHYGRVPYKLPELPQAAKIDLTPFGGTGQGWRILAQHKEFYDSVARSSQLRFHYREIDNA